MSRSLLTLILVGVMCLFGVDHASAKGGKGGGKGRGSSAFKGSGGTAKGRPSQRPSIGSPKKAGGANSGRFSSPSHDKSPATKPQTGHGRPEATGPSRSPHEQSRGNGKGSKGLSRQPLGSETTTDSNPKLTGRDHARAVQRQNEERKLAHRQQTAQKLREIAERNGNDNLLQTADRMDQKAIEHYEKRLAKIDGPATDGDPVDLGDLSNEGVDQGLAGDGSSADDAFADPETPLQDVSLPDPPLTESAPRDVGPLAEELPENVARRLAQEDRKLQHQLDVAQRLRDIAARNGNENLLQTAERMETMAADRYQKQLEKLGLFSDPPIPREPLPTVNELSI